MRIPNILKFVRISFLVISSGLFLAAPVPAQTAAGNAGAGHNAGTTTMAQNNGGAAGVNGTENGAAAGNNGAAVAGENGNNGAAANNGYHYYNGNNYGYGLWGLVGLIGLFGLLRGGSSSRTPTTTRTGEYTAPRP